MMKRRFQQFVLLGIGLTAIVEALAWFYIPQDVLRAELLATDGYGAVISGGLPLYVLLISARLLIMFGLLTFHPTARSLFLLLVLVTIGLSIFEGFSVVAPLEAPFLLIATIVDGIILALAYYSPAAESFRRAYDWQEDP